MTHIFRHPKYYTELRAERKKHQASSLGGPAKSQAPSIKPQASSWVGPPIIKPPTLSRKKSRVGPPNLKPPTATT